MRILLVEDDKQTARFILMGLKQEGYSVNHAENGEDGLHFSEIEDYDLAIVDIMMPKLDGLKMIEQLRKKKISMPVIILSAKNTVDDRVRGLQAGGDDYLVKPFAFTELLARIKAIIRRANSKTETTVLHSIPRQRRHSNRGAKRIRQRHWHDSALQHTNRRNRQSVGLYSE